MGRSVTNIAVDCRTDRSSLDLGSLKNMSYFPPPLGEEWRIPLAKELIEIRDGKLDVSGVGQEAIEKMIDEVCTK